MALKIKMRCMRCMKVLRDDGTCSNEKCSRYVPSVEQSSKTKKSKEKTGA